ncbi:small secreted protein [Streptomyces sp. NPDC050485]|uniref:small secreted protein n=1 Tax=Streptomyces sp. NPDC050485 TaxID=3365617 RepID=UPI0037A5C538
MNKKLAAALSGGAVLMLTLSGCSDDSNKKVDDWAKTFCNTAQPQFKKITDANAAIQAQTKDDSKPADVQKTDSAAFQQISDAYKALGAAVDKAGAPPVKDGATTQQEAVKELNASSVSYAGLKKKVDALNAGDQAAFAKGLEDIATELGKISSTGDASLKKLESGDVGKAMQKQPGCQKQTPSSPAPSASGAGAPPAKSAAPSQSASPSGSASPSASQSSKP